MTSARDIPARPAVETTLGIGHEIDCVLPYRVQIANGRVARRRADVELRLAAAVLCDPTRGWLCAAHAGVRGYHFAEPDLMAIWTACGYRRFAPLPDVLATARRCLRLCGLWEEDEPGQPPGRVWRNGLYAGPRWYWGALVGFATYFRRHDGRLIRAWSAELLELDRRQREAERGLAYACRVLAGGGEHEKGAIGDALGTHNARDATRHEPARLERQAG